MAERRDRERGSLFTHVEHDLALQDRCDPRLSGLPSLASATSASGTGRPAVSFTVTDKRSAFFPARLIGDAPDVEEVGPGEYPSRQAIGLAGGKPGLRLYRTSW